jgi:hypothetical protein
VLDQFFEDFKHDRSRTDRGLRFEQWMVKHYDREGLKARYAPQGFLYKFASFLVDRVLRRE